MTTKTETKIISKRDQLLETWTGAVPENPEQYYEVTGIRFRLYKEEKDTGITREQAFATWKAALEKKLNG